MDFALEMMEQNESLTENIIDMDCNGLVQQMKKILKIDQEILQLNAETQDFRVGPKTLKAADNLEIF